jgi:hypothetical protein
MTGKEHHDISAWPRHGRSRYSALQKSSDLLEKSCSRECRIARYHIAAGLVARIFGFTPEFVSSIAIKSTTVPIAVEVAKIVHGNPTLTAVLVVITGMLGASFGPWLMDRLAITNPFSRSQQSSSGNVVAPIEPRHLLSSAPLERGGERRRGFRVAHPLARKDRHSGNPRSTLPKPARSGRTPEAGSENWRLWIGAEQRPRSHRANEP